jgi:hypothetical protein
MYVDTGLLYYDVWTCRYIDLPTFRNNKMLHFQGCQNILRWRLLDPAILWRKKFALNHIAYRFLKDTFVKLHTLKILHKHFGPYGQ